MKFIVKHPGQESFIIEVDEKADTLPILQGLVGGYIELIRGLTDNPSIDLWCDEEGRFKADPRYNIVHPRDQFQGIVGTVVVTRSTPGGRTVGLRDKELDSVMLALDSLGNQ